MLAEDALREGERIWRVVVDSIPGQVALLKSERRSRFRQSSHRRVHGQDAG
jgi:hypothetical protein